ncbi:hypothetical protein P7C71_g5182, partial [Lecanoromycetidae sp. Uapishka_2]
MLTTSQCNEDYNQRCNDEIEQYYHLHDHSDTDPSEVSGNVEEKYAQGGQTIGPYPNCTHHTTGLFSTIFKTQQASPPRTLAIKLTTPSQCQPPHNVKREARILAKAKHPNVIQLLETHTLRSGHFLLVFPFQPLDLAALLNKGRLESPQQKRILHDLFTALSHLHSLHIIHRDIKPSNILLASSTGPAYLADFGIAWMPDDPASEAANEKITDVGTTCYRPPELLFGKRDYGVEIDLWAAGCVVAEVVRGEASKGTEGKGSGWSLFDAGELGSELALVKNIFQTLGTPDEKIWPETKDLPDWGKMTFVNFPGKSWAEILPNASTEGKDLVSQLVRYQSTERLRAANVLKHVFFQNMTANDGGMMS